MSQHPQTIQHISNKFTLKISNGTPPTLIAIEEKIMAFEKTLRFKQNQTNYKNKKKLFQTSHTRNLRLSELLKMIKTLY